MAIVNIGKENIVDLLSNARELRDKYGIVEKKYPNTFTYFGNRYRNLVSKTIKIINEHQ